MTCDFQILEVFCEQNLITTSGLPDTTTWSDKIPNYTVSHSLLLIFWDEKIIQFSYCEQDSVKRVFKHEIANYVLNTHRSHNVKTAIFHFFTFFALQKSLLFHPKPWFSKMHHICCLFVVLVFAQSVCTKILFYSFQLVALQLLLFAEKSWKQKANMIRVNGY